MTVLGRKATGVGLTNVRFGPYLVVGVIALVAGMLAGTALQQIGGSPEVAAAQGTMTDRGTGVMANLPGLWESGLAQQAVISEQHLLQGRFQSGLAQQQIMTQRHALLEGRIESGLAQQQAMKAAAGSLDAWTIRAHEMSGHLEGLITSGQAQQTAIRGE